jgi:hypothetical protein
VYADGDSDEDSENDLKASLRSRAPSTRDKALASPRVSSGWVKVRAFVILVALAPWRWQPALCFARGASLAVGRCAPARACVLCGRQQIRSCVLPVMAVRAAWAGASAGWAVKHC